MNGTLTADDRAGGVYRYADVTGAAFHSYMNRTWSWWLLSDVGRDEINESLPFIRTPATRRAIPAGTTPSNLHFGLEVPSQRDNGTSQSGA